LARGNLQLSEIVGLLSKPKHFTPIVIVD
jgi:hypothetical protein